MPRPKMTKSSQVGTVVFVKKQSWVNGRTPLLICYTTFRKLPYYPDPGVLGFVHIYNVVSGDQSIHL